ncbi:hypothetical protein ACFQ4L_03085 [Lapidilactobacillus mulanensis]|uniref:DUF2283 domain-containing protein n=1 Tax=Lapidilactobacillus mulanensis TaxID=2485999 RepID=A0ABW4DPA4_9LACO|nr:hypothetical protein [Lapidilactobacillus mulanensis]
MLEIKYHEGQEARSIQYKSPTDFVAVQQLEVPDLEDYYRIDEVLLDGQPQRQFAGVTVGELFNAYNH